MLGRWVVLFIASILILGSLLIPEDVLSAIFIDSFDVSTEDLNPSGLAFNTDGTKMFVLGFDGQDVNEYACTTGFDVSTCTYSGDGERKDVSGEETEPHELAFNTDGTKMFVLGQQGDDEVHEYNCTAFDVSTCVFVDSFSVNDEEATAQGLAFITNGTKMFVTGTAGDDVNEYFCTTGFDVSTCKYAGDVERLDISTEETDPRGLAFNTDGTKMFVIGTIGDDVNEYACATGFDVSTCVYSGDTERFSVATEEGAPQGLAFNTDGTKMFVVGLFNDSVYEYDLPVAFDVSSARFVSTPSGGSGDQNHKTRPTFGLSHTTSAQQVEGGFSFNGMSHDITHNFWTPFAEQPVKLGEANSFSAKVLAEQELRVQEFLFGIPEIGEAHNAELGVEIFYNRDGEIERVQVIQKTDIIDVDSVKIMHSKSNCLFNETDEKCDITLLSMKFLEPLKDKIMAIKAIDFKGRTHITYLNEGFDISGDSLNPMNTKLIPGTVKYEGLIEITQTAKYSDIWVAKDGREFQINEFGSVNQINQSFEHPIETGALKNRNSLEFSALKMYHIDMAQMLAEQLYPHYTDESFGEINDIFAYDYPETIYWIDNPELQKNLVIESEKAQKIIDDSVDHLYYQK